MARNAWRVPSDTITFENLYSLKKLAHNVTAVSPIALKIVDQYSCSANLHTRCIQAVSNLHTT
jgi:hypothetical protein